MQPMTKKEICIQYIELLEKGNIEQLLTLFNKDGVVDSPLYGLKQAAAFYSELTSDTNNSELKLLGIFEENESDTVALYFNYRWTLKNNEIVNFDVVDIVEFDADNKISKLKIIYDTIVARGLVKQLDI
jgi:hypothetical protein